MGSHFSLLEATQALRGAALPNTARAFFAPGRANLLGAHLDYSGGCVMPVALSKGTCAILVPRSDDRLRMCSAKFPGQEVELALSELRPHRAAVWSAYLEGAVYMARERWGAVPGLDIYVDADLPMARGLSSSASVQSAALFGLARLLGREAPVSELIELANRSEAEYVGVQCGPLDPTAIFLGKQDCILHYDCSDGSFHHLPMPAERVAIAVMDSGVKRELAGSAFNQRVQECASSLQQLQSALPHLAHLAQLSSEELEAHRDLLDPVQQLRCEHVVSEVARTKQASDGLRAGRLDVFGEAMTQAHVSLRELYEVSTPELDALVEAAVAVPGCYGSRLTGAGFGGCTVAILDPDSVDEFRASIPRAYRKATSRETEVMIFRPTGGPEEWSLDSSNQPRL
jgi:galactokinase